MSAMVGCEWCGELVDRSEYKDGRCPACVDDRCEECGEKFSHDELEDGFCEDCQNTTCETCMGSGMPSTGPPDVGSCSACGGSGERKRTRENDDGERSTY